MRELVLFFVFAIYSISHGFCADVQVEVQVDKKEVLIGDLIQFKLSVVRPSDSQLKPPLMEKDAEHFKVKDFKITEKKLRGKRIQTFFMYTLTTFETGQFQLGPLHMAYQIPQGDTQEITTQPMTITIKSMLDQNVKDPDIRGPKPPLSLGRNWGWIYLVLIIITLLGTIAFILVRKLKLDAPFSSQTKVVILSAKDEALQRIEALGVSDAYKQAQWKEVYSMLSEILRHYLERQYHFNALEMTSFECLRELKKKKIHIEITDKLKLILNESDLVKFAKYTPALSAVPGDLKTAREIVEQSQEENHAV